MKKFTLQEFDYFLNQDGWQHDQKEDEVRSEFDGCTIIYRESDSGTEWEFHGFEVIDTNAYEIDQIKDFMPVDFSATL